MSVVKIINKSSCLTDQKGKVFPPPQPPYFLLLFFQFPFLILVGRESGYDLDRMTLG